MTKKLVRPADAWDSAKGCAIRGCGEPVRSKAFCAHHYDMWHRYGHPLAGQLWQGQTARPPSKDKVRKAYHAMKTRCLNRKNKSWPEYGGRGITICQRWLDSFENFVADMGIPPVGTSLERNDVHGNYEPGNCKWGTFREQARNTRNTKLSVSLVAEAKRRRLGGESVAAIARDLGVSYSCMYYAVTGKSWQEVEAVGHG